MLNRAARQGGGYLEEMQARFDKIRHAAQQCSLPGGSTGRVTVQPARRVETRLRPRHAGSRRPALITLGIWI